MLSIHTWIHPPSFSCYLNVTDVQDKAKKKMQNIFSRFDMWWWTSLVILFSLHAGPYLTFLQLLSKIHTFYNLGSFGTPVLSMTWSLETDNRSKECTFPIEHCVGEDFLTGPYSKNDSGFVSWVLEKFNFFPISTIFSHLVTGWVKILSFARLQFKKKINTSLPGPKRPQKAVGRLTLQHIVSFEWDTCNECYTGHCRCRIITEGFLEGNTLDTVKTRNMSQNLLGEIVLR